MIGARFVFLLAALVGVPFLAQSAVALQQNDADEAIKKFLSSQKSDTEDTDSQGSAVTDLNGDGKSEVVLVWTLLGPTYWRNTLTVFSKTAGGYKAVASLQLTGEAKLSSVKAGVIALDQKVYAKNDPVCCPTVMKKTKYRWVGKKISEVTK